MVQDGSVAACASQPALPCRGVGVGTCNQSLIFEKIINRVRPIHQRILILWFLWVVFDRSVQQKVFTAEKGEGEEIQTKQGLLEPPSPSISERRGGKLQAAFSFHCIRVCLLVGAGWQAPLGQRSAVQMPSRGKKMHHEQVVVLKGTQSSKEK